VIANSKAKNDPQLHAARPCHPNAAGFPFSGQLTLPASSRQCTWSKWAEMAVGLCATAYCMYYYAMGCGWAIFAFPFCYWVVCSDMMHNGSHFAVSTVPLVNTVSTYIGGFHTSYYLWALQHVIGHHVHTNVINMVT